MADYFDREARASTTLERLTVLNLVGEKIAAERFKALKAIADPVTRWVLECILADEATHIKFGEMWVPRLADTAEKRAQVEVWKAEMLGFGRRRAEQDLEVVGEAGLDFNGEP